ncbi:MAG TPA: hypothetical protein PKJ26_01830, partial [Candidatus Woesebacteria bacterium]|nr:hypothetical protein [Candidatus Woesebacteria bacterium]
TKNFSFESNQVRTISLQYQLSAPDLAVLAQQPLVHFYWNGEEIAWLSKVARLSSWVSLPIPGDELGGKLSISVQPSRVQMMPTQLLVEQLTSQRIVATQNSKLEIKSDDELSTVFVALTTTGSLHSSTASLSISPDILSDTGELTFWSVDLWGNTESPKTIQFHVVRNQADPPRVIWQHFENQMLYLVVESNFQEDVLVSHYRLLNENGERISLIRHPWVESSTALHQSGAPISLSFLILDSIHAGRVQSVDQFGNESLASNLILF